MLRLSFGWRCVAAVLLALAPVLVAATSSVAGEGETTAFQLAVSSSGDQSLTVSFDVSDFTVEPLHLDGQTLATIHIPDTYQTADPGRPQVPVRGVWLGVPTVEGVTIRLIIVKSEMLPAIRLPIAPQLTIEVNGLDVLDGAVVEETRSTREISQTETGWFPPTPVDLATVGYLGDQAVVQVLLHPVQVNLRTGEVRLNRHVEAQIWWSPTAEKNMPIISRSGEAYEELLRQTILNYPDLGRVTSQAERSLPSPGLDGAPQAVTAESPALKVGVDHDGVYQITYAQLVSAGINPRTIDPRTIKITSQGQQIPILVHGENDGAFDQGDAVIFYGQAMRGPYTVRNVYWLSAGGDAGLRMAGRDGTPLDGTPSPSQFLRTLHAEEDTAYWQAMPGQSGEDRWYWGSRISPSTSGLPPSRNYQVTLKNLSQSAPSAALRVRLKGYTSLAHRTRIYFNGQLVDERPWSGQIPFTHFVSVPPALLHNGANTVTVEAIDAGAAVDQLLVNWIEIDYWNRYVAEDDELLFTSPTAGRQQFVVAGLSNPDMLVLDVTNRDAPVQVTGFASVISNGSHIVRFDGMVQDGTQYLVVAAPRYRTPTSFELDQPTSWRLGTNGADYIIITHESFYDSALSLAQHRQRQGLRTAVVKIGDVYDEFSGGVFTPHAIRDFLQHAYENWAAPAPAFVVLLGDSSQDYKDNLHNGTVTYVPSMNIESDLFGEVSSDNWFVLVSGDDVLPDMFVGRLAAQSSTEASAMAQNLIRYDQAPPAAAWNTQVLLVADDDEIEFRTLAEQLANALPADYSRHRVYVADYPPGNPRTDIVNHINSGVVLATYIGHGEHSSWGIWNNGQQRILEMADVAALTNVDKLPFVVVGNCLNGFFAGPRSNPAIAEGFQRLDRAGAVAVWAPSGLGYATGHAVLLRELYRAIFTRYQLALGRSTTTAKLTTYAQGSLWAELVETYILFGDPATRLGIPVPHPFVQATEPAHQSRGVALDQPIRISFSAPMDPNTVHLLGTDIPQLTPVPAWNASYTMVTYAHHNLVPGRTYDLSVEGRDASGRPLGPWDTPNPWRFTASTDGTPPEVVIRVAGGNGWPAYTLSPLELRFNEPVRIDSVIYAHDPPASGSLAWSSDRQLATFFHAPWTVGQTYRFTVLAATDVAGNRLILPVGYSFEVQQSQAVHLPLILHR